MINPAFLISGIGMMLAGVVPVLWWRYRTLVPWRDFFLGAALWVLAISAKAGMDLSVTPIMIRWLSGIYAAIGIAIVSGVYLGLRTGILESGFTYAAALRTRIAKSDFQQAVALGMGFGAAEAVLLGLSSLANVSVLIAFPQIIDLMPPEARAAVLSQLSLPSIAAAAPVIERAGVMAIHVFCTVLAVHAARSGRALFFISSLGMRALLDGMLPVLALSFGTDTISGIYAIEAFVAAAGAASLIGTLRMKVPYRWNGKRRAGGERRAAFMCIALCVMLCLLAVAAALPSAAAPLERKTVDFGSFSGRYEITLNGTPIGYSEFSSAGGASVDGKSAFVIKEEANLTGGGYGIYTEGTLYATVDGRPLAYNETIRKGFEEKRIVCRFAGGMVNQTVTENGEDRSFTAEAGEDAFIAANNMAGHWALLFRAARPGTERAYMVRIYNPNAEAGTMRTLQVVSAESVMIGGKSYEAYAFSESSGNIYYVTEDGVLLKVRNGPLSITLSERPQEGGAFG